MMKTIILQNVNIITTSCIAKAHLPEMPEYTRNIPLTRGDLEKLEFLHIAVIFKSIGAKLMIEFLFREVP